MNKEIVKLLKELGLLNEEIERCFNVCPGLDSLDLTRAQQCLTVLVKMGYPRVDLGLLIAVNPTILFYNPTDLELKLKKLGDVSEALKSDPFII